MTANRVPGKLVLPTVETCRHRHEVKTTDLAQCELLREISGVVDGKLCQISRDACAACCESFPPTTARWNSVIASLVYDLSNRVSDNAGVDGCSINEAQRLRATAVEILQIEPSANSHVIPIRASQPCCHLGDPRESHAASGEVAFGEVEVQFRCTHPAHDLTTHDHCRLCRDWSRGPQISRRLTLPEIVPHAPMRSGSTVRRWSVGIVTAPRREATLEWCLDSLARADWTEPHLFVDGLMRIPQRYDRLPITWRERSVGAWPNYFLALSEMVQSNPSADAYLVLQDDAVLFDRGDLRTYLEATLWPGEQLGLVSLYCPQAYTVFEPGWHELARPWFWGALAFVFPRELAREFIGNRDVIAHRWAGPNNGQAQVDVLIGEWAAAHAHPVHFPSPSLAQHVGNTSSLWREADNRGFRRADWFAGDLESPFSDESAWSGFPEEHFPCHAEFRSEYERRNRIGRERMSQRRVVLCGLCRNVRHFLPKFAARVERLGAMFREYRVVLFENDSTDATLEFLRDWRKINNRVHVLSEQLGAIHYPSIRSADRATRLAEYRNRCRSYALEHFGHFENVIVADTDLAGGWSDEGIANTFGHDDWDFVGSSGLLRVHFDRASDWLQYDAWAFRAIGHPHPHSNVEVNSMIFNRSEPLLPVHSCFGGLGVYRMEAIKAAEYSGPDCEHVILHDRMRQQGYGRLFLNPSQIVLYSPL